MPHKQSKGLSNATAYISLAFIVSWAILFSLEVPQGWYKLAKDNAALRTYGRTSLEKIVHERGSAPGHNYNRKEYSRDGYKNRTPQQAYATSALSFEANIGQTDSRVDFIARGSGYSLFLTSAGPTLRMRSPAKGLDDDLAGQQKGLGLDVNPSPGGVFGMKLLGAQSDPSVEGLKELPSKSNYFLGQDAGKWRTNVTQYSRVKYHDVYPGVDLVFYGTQGQLEYDFVVAPGANPGAIRLQPQGAKGTRIERGGDLVGEVAGSEIRQYRPIAYQDWNGHRHLLKARYVDRGSGEIGFEVAGYRADRALVIDPVLAYSSFLGGSLLDSAHAVAVDAFGNVYLTGETASLDFPTQNPEQPANAGGSDAFITKIDPSGNLIFSTYLGGSGNENNFRTGVESSGIAVDGAGNVSVTGRTSSTDFPTINALSSSYQGGDYDAFIAQLSADGTTLLYSTYLGGAANDSGNGIAVDSSGSIYVTGGTKSDVDFPISPGAFQRFPVGQLEAFVTKIDPRQQGAASLVYSTFLGGGGIDRGTGITVDGAGNAYVTGLTESTDFPVTPGSFQSTYNGGRDAFVAVLTPDGTAQIYSTFLGGRGADLGSSIAVDAAGNAYVAGETTSPDFPLMNAFQSANGGSTDAFVAELDPTGSILKYSTYLGGTAIDRATSIALDRTGKIFLAGETSSDNFPTASPFQGARGGLKDAYVAQLDPSLAGVASLLFSSFLGGSSNDIAFGIALNSSGDAWVVGETASANFPLVSATQPTRGGGTSDAFVARITVGTTTPDFSVSANPAFITVAAGGTGTSNVTLTPSGGFNGDVALSISGLPSDANGSFTPSIVSITDATSQTSTLTVTTAGTTPAGSYPLTITATSLSSTHTTMLRLTVTTGTSGADLLITKSASANPVELGTNFTYTIKVFNQGPDAATGVTVSDPLPAVTFVSATATQGTCSGTSTITCNLGALAVGTNATVTLTVKSQTAGSFSNTASVSGDQPDPIPDNNSATSQTTVQAACPGPGPCMLVPDLTVRTVTNGLAEPTGIAFLGADDFFVIEKSTGKVKRVTGGVVQANPVLDLAVNSASERGLLGIALHPNFATNGFVYLYWTCSGQPAAADCDSTLGDSTDLAQVPLLGNRVDRFFWDGTALTAPQNIIRLHAYQKDADANGNFNQPLRGNHNGGKIIFGPDGKLYILIGDNGRRGNMQNIAVGVLPNGQDDQFGGPQPDNAHFTGVIIRLNDDGTTPTDNPFFDCGSMVSDEACGNVRRTFAYGVRNSFGMAFDPLSGNPGNLWNEENGDDSFDEINLVPAGANNGWVQVMGPIDRIADYKLIETSPEFFGLQQVRWSPTLIADTPEDAKARMNETMLPGTYNDPRFSWKYAVAPSPIGFVSGGGLGVKYQGDMFVGAARPFLAGGYLFDFKLLADRSDLALGNGRVAENSSKFDIAGSEGFLIGQDFGITTDIQTSPCGTVYVVSLSGAVYEVLSATR